ncbi:EAL domain-containing protein [Maritalea porphyrae]|uniref:EAL domain-containing protein n=1 Tax=Maritalea porphyrae TaxID=880732 RepID=UPI0022AF5D23|nr:EAL domain-containing protein [Maritalea porphyrae]MCZ4271638.1 EAL domain-containing protein [Maritalea porphyrae]
MRVSRPRFVDDALFYHDEWRTGRYGQFQLNSAFQPIYCVSDLNGPPCGHEGLVRIFTQGDLFSPLDFFAIVPPEDRFFIEWMCRAIHISNFHLVKQPGQLLFVNLDPATYVDVKQAEYEVGFMVERMRELGVNPAEFVCEVIEEQTQDDQVFADVIDCFKSYGIKVAVDDFGVRFSDQKRVARLRPDVVKIDGAWFRELLGTAKGKQQLISTIHGFGDNDIRVIVEGVETQAQLDFVSEVGDCGVQGFLLGRPEGAICY